MAEGPKATGARAEVAKLVRSELKRRGKTDAEIEAGKAQARRRLASGDDG